jgi:aldehyde:ferredoxin oxidoreductase
MTGLDISAAELYRLVVPRIHTLERMIKLREGQTAHHDVFWDEVFQLPWVKCWLTKEKAIAFMSDFYTAQGWNRIDGTPEEKTLEGLGLEDANNTPGLPIETEGIN